MISNDFWWLVPEDPTVGNLVIEGSRVSIYWPHNLRAAIRPLIKLSSEATGTVSSTVTIDK